MAKRYELTVEQWRRIEGVVPGKPGDPGRSGTNNLRFVNGVLWVLRSGAHWHDLPERYGNWKTPHKRFTRWARAGVWERVFTHVVADPNNACLMLDSTLVRAHQQATAGKGGTATRLQAEGRSRGGLTPKIRPAAEGRGRPLRLLLTPGQRGDVPQAPVLLTGLAPRRVPADTACDTNGFRRAVAERGAEAVIPCNPTRRRPIP